MCSQIARGLNAQHRVGQTVEQRAVEGDAVGVKDRGELRDGALVRGVFPRAAGEEEDEQKGVGEQQNENNDVFEPCGIHGVLLSERDQSAIQLAPTLSP